MNLKMLLSRNPEDVKILNAEMNKLAARLDEVLPSLEERREEFMQEQLDVADNEAYFQTTDWEIDLGIFSDTGRLPSGYSDLKFYARLLHYIQSMRNATLRRFEEMEEKLLASADYFFFHLKDLAEQGNPEARKAYEELKKVRPGGDKA